MRIDRTSQQPTGTKDSQSVDILIGDLLHAPDTNVVFQAIDQEGVVGFVPFHSHDKYFSENPKLMPFDLINKLGGIGNLRVIGVPSDFGFDEFGGFTRNKEADEANSTD